MHSDSAVIFFALSVSTSDEGAVRALEWCRYLLAMVVLRPLKSRWKNRPRTTRFQWGALRFTPGIAVTNVGVDNNVFNDPEIRRATRPPPFGPAISLWTNVGRLRHQPEERRPVSLLQEVTTTNDRGTRRTTSKSSCRSSRITPFANRQLRQPASEAGVRNRLASANSTNVVTLRPSCELSGKTKVVLSGTRTTTRFRRQGNVPRK